MTVADLRKVLEEMVADQVIADDYLVGISDLSPAARDKEMGRVYPVRGMAVVDRYPGSPKMFILTSDDPVEHVSLTGGDA
jgi:hypothetical protein